MQSATASAKYLHAAYLQRAGCPATVERGYKISIEKRGNTRPSRLSKAKLTAHSINWPTELKWARLFTKCQDFIGVCTLGCSNSSQLSACKYLILLRRVLGGCIYNTPSI